MNFLDKIKRDMQKPMNQRQRGSQATLVDTRSLQELVRHFESMDTAYRADASPAQTINRTQGLVHEVQASFHNLGVEETMDIVMYTIAEIRKLQIRDDRRKDFKAAEETRKQRALLDRVDMHCSQKKLRDDLTPNPEWR